MRGGIVSKNISRAVAADATGVGEEDALVQVVHHIDIGTGNAEVAAANAITASADFSLVHAIREDRPAVEGSGGVAEGHIVIEHAVDNRPGRLHVLRLCDRREATAHD